MDSRPPPSLEEAQARQESALATRWREIQDEARQDQWAFSMEREISSLVDTSLPDAGVVSHRVECRSTRCVLTIDWADNAAAKRFFPRLVHERQPDICEKTGFLVDPNPDGGRPSRSETFYRCHAVTSEGKP